MHLANHNKLDRKIHFRTILQITEPRSISCKIPLYLLCRAYSKSFWKILWKISITNSKRIRRLLSNIWFFSKLCYFNVLEFANYVHCVRRHETINSKNYISAISVQLKRPKECQIFHLVLCCGLVIFNRDTKRNV